MVSSQLVKVKRDTLRPCMTCPLCHNFFKDATTISTCLHTCSSLSHSISMLLLIFFYSLSFGFWRCSCLSTPANCNALFFVWPPICVLASRCSCSLIYIQLPGFSWFGFSMRFLNCFWLVISMIRFPIIAIAWREG